jgi:hypothetical protein
MTEDLEKYASEAVKIADKLPEKYQQVAFTEIFRGLQGGNNLTAPSKTETKAMGGKSSGPTSEGFPKWFEQLVEGLPEMNTIADGTRDQQTVWATIKLFSKGKDANTGSISKLIKDIGISPERRSNLSGRLGRLTPKYLSREEIPDGNGAYRYFPTRACGDIFTN